jgi:competence/damage-inducible protein CinA-like protein
MPTAEIITIGTEILLGEIIDTNSRTIAIALRDHGVDIYRTMSIGDNPKRIADAIQEATRRAEIVITTGGLGPTVDDPTREAYSLAFGVSMVFREELWEQVVERFSRFGRIPTDNNRKQAYLPLGATALENPVGTAPAFRMETERGAAIALPGVPHEMEFLLENTVFPYLKKRFGLQQVLKIRILHTAGVGESLIDEKIADLEQLANPTVGLAAHSGQVDVRITAKANSVEETDALIEKIEQELQARLGSWVYGSDQETLASVAIRSIADRGWRLVLLEAGLGGNLVHQFPTASEIYLYAAVHPLPPGDPEALFGMASDLRSSWTADVVLAVGLYDRISEPFIQLALITPHTERSRRISYGGPPPLAATRAVNLSLDWLRKR